MLYELQCNKIPHLKKTGLNTAQTKFVPAKFIINNRITIYNNKLTINITNYIDNNKLITNTRRDVIRAR